MDKPQVDRDRRHSAGDRHRPDQPGAHLALDRRHDDRAQRPPEAAVRARGALCTAANCGKPVRRDTPRAIYAELASARRRGRRSARCASCFPVAVPKNFTRSRSPRSCSEQQGYTRIHAARRRHARRGAGPLPPRQRRARARHRGDRGGAARRPRPRERARRRRSDPPKRCERWKFLDRPALRRLRPPLPRPDARAVLVQLAARRLRDLPRLRPHHRRRLRPRDPRRAQDAARRRDQAVADASRTRNARTT